MDRIGPCDPKCRQRSKCAPCVTNEDIQKVSQGGIDQKGSDCECTAKKTGLHTADQQQRKNLPSNDKINEMLAKLTYFCKHHCYAASTSSNDKKKLKNINKTPSLINEMQNLISEHNSQYGIKEDQTIMPLPISQRIDVKKQIQSKHHPCDPPIPCDPFKVPDGSCPEPYVCLDKVKNPALPNEITRCQSGEFLNAKRCAKIQLPFPCDPPQPCVIGELMKKQCNEPLLYLERVKNPAPKKQDNCDEIHEPYPPVHNYPFGF